MKSECCVQFVLRHSSQKVICAKLITTFQFTNKPLSRVIAYNWHIAFANAENNPNFVWQFYISQQWRSHKKGHKKNWSSLKWGIMRLLTFPFRMCQDHNDFIAQNQFHGITNNNLLAIITAFVFLTWQFYFNFLFPEVCSILQIALLDKRMPRQVENWDFT